MANHFSIPALRTPWTAAAAAAKSLQSCPTLCDPIDGSPPGSAIPGILQARILGWVAISFSNAWKLKVKVKSLSRVRLLATPWTAAYQAPLSTGFRWTQLIQLFKSWNLLWHSAGLSIVGGKEAFRKRMLSFYWCMIFRKSNFLVEGDTEGEQKLPPL